MHLQRLLVVVTVLTGGLGLGLLRPSEAVDISRALDTIPSLSSFARLLSSTPIPSELSSRTSLTLLAVPDSHFSSTLPDDPSTLPTVLRSHVLPQYLTLTSLSNNNNNDSTVISFPTLHSHCSLSLSNSNGSLALAVGSPSSFSSSSSKASLLSQLASFPPNLSIIAVDSFIFPFSSSHPNDTLAAPPLQPPPPPPPPPPPSPPPINITSVLLDAHDFNVAASLLEASGVAAEFEGYEHGVGITVFVPTDLAFATSDRNSRLRSLPADTKALVLKFHALHSYYPLGSLQSIVNPVQPTVATEDTAAGLYTLNITRVNGSVAIGTGLVQAAITRTVFDQNPVAIFAVSKVLLPKEVFGHNRSNEAASAAAPSVELAGTAPDVAAPVAMGLGTDGKGSTLVSGAARRGMGTTDFDYLRQKFQIHHAVRSAEEHAVPYIQVQAW